jgi:hypothetical protein
VAVVEQEQLLAVLAVQALVVQEQAVQTARAVQQRQTHAAVAVQQQEQAPVALVVLELLT